MTIVLIGQNTWQRKHVDWEIGYSLTETNKNSRSRLLGILLPCYREHKEPTFNCNRLSSEDGQYYTPCNIPPRLYDNIQSLYAKVYSYPYSRYKLQQWIHDAFQRRNSGLHRNNRRYFANNRNSSHWE